MTTYKSTITKHINTLSSIADDMTRLGALLCTHYDYLAQNGYDYKELLFLCDACGMLADHILQISDNLIEILYSTCEDNVVNIDSRPIDDSPVGA